MMVPAFVRRAVLRIAVSSLVTFGLIGGSSLVLERQRFGPDEAATRARLEADVRTQFAQLITGLDTAVEALSNPPPRLPSGEPADGPTVRELFERVGFAESRSPLDGLALTIADAEGQPIAWSSRPGAIPSARLTGPASLFLAPSPLGLRLVRIEPLLEAASGRRLGTVVAETSFSGTTPGGEDAADGFTLPTSIVPVSVRPGYEGLGGGTAAGSIVVPAPNGIALAVIDVPVGAIAQARRARRASTAGLLLGVAAVAALALLGPLADLRRVATTRRRHLGLTLAMIALLGAARSIAWVGLSQAGLAAPPLAPQATTPAALWPLLASPFDFLLTALMVAAIATVVITADEHWRRRRWLVRMAMTGERAGTVVAFVAAQIAAGVLVGGLVLAYESRLLARLSETSVDILHFSFRPWDPDRLAVTSGLLVMHAAVVAIAVTLLRFGAAPWLIPREQRIWRWTVPGLWIVGGVVAAWGARLVGDTAFVPATLAVAFAATAAGTFGRYRLAFRHASQAARLMAMFLVLALPSLVFYPFLVDVAARAHRQLVETHYAAEVVDQRRDLQLYLTEALREIDRLSGIDELIAAADPVTTPTPPTDAAFAVWSQTALATQRLTSSVELFDAKGDIVSRFALKLPDSTNPIGEEPTCDWEVFEEVSPFFSEERKLLHASRALCRDPAAGPRAIAGSITVHVMLDYSNLSFISAQSPYVAMLRSASPERTPHTPAEEAEFIVYGWSRRVLYMSGRDAWPLTEAIFTRALESREPFWAPVRRGDALYDVYYLNDRAAIYALGYPRLSSFGHLVNLAELAALAGVVFVTLLLGGLVYGRVTMRTPTSGRALLREVRVSFYRKLFLAFVLAAVGPVLALAFVTRAYIASLMQADIEMEAVRTAASASRVVEDFGEVQAQGGGATTVTGVNDSLVVWLSRVIAQDVNVFDGADLLASSERNLFASGLLPTRTSGEVYRAIVLEARPAYVMREQVGGYEYLVAAAPVRVQNRSAILTVPLTLRQREIEAQSEELDRRVLLAALAFILVGAAIGYSMAERIADPVNQLTRASQRIARGDLDARIVVASSDELRRLVDAFNRMAADLQRQRGELERTNRLAAWADMARQVAHDIKNPLTPIQLNAEHLLRVHRDRGRPLEPVLDECIANILTQVRLLRQIAGEFSSFASSPNPQPTAAAVPAVLAEIVEPYRAALEGRVVIVLDAPRDLPPAYVDPLLLGRALTNVIENALHAMPSGGTLTVTAGLAANERLEVKVADTGIGMTAEARRRIFEPYFSTRTSGTGLGLTIAKRNVELNAGTIAVDSTEGVGTTVVITVPLARADA